MPTATNESMSHSSVRARIVQNFSLVWIDADIHSNNEDMQHTLEQLRSVINHLTLFTQLDNCVAFLQEIQSEKAFVITSGAFGQALVPEIHSLISLDAIFVYCSNQVRHERWTKKWPKVKGVYTEVARIVEQLQAAVKRSNQDTTPISFVDMDVGKDKVDLHRLEASFMYTQIFKNILLNMKHDDQSRSMLIKFCREKFAGNPYDLAIIDEFCRDYQPEKAIWWYTRECFIYQMLNRSLRLLDGDIIVNMGFFIHDLHRQLEQLHKEQLSSYDEKPLLVFRGQGLSTTDFDKLRKTQGGLVAFNSFLSTSREKSNSLAFARCSAANLGTIGILFVITIDPNLPSTPFVDVSEISYFPGEGEILFSMHTVFRIGAMKSIENSDRLFEVPLTMTSENDPQLHTLTARMEKEIEGQGWARVGYLMITLGQPEKAQELYLTLLDHSPKELDKSVSYHQLGCIKTS